MALSGADHAFVQQLAYLSQRGEVDAYVVYKTLRRIGFDKTRVQRMMGGMFTYGMNIRHPIMRARGEESNDLYEVSNRYVDMCNGVGAAEASHDRHSSGEGSNCQGDPPLSTRLRGENETSTTKLRGMSDDVRVPAKPCPPSSHRHHHNESTTIRVREERLHRDRGRRHSDPGTHKPRCTSEDTDSLHVEAHASPVLHPSTDAPPSLPRTGHSSRNHAQCGGQESDAETGRDVLPRIDHGTQQPERSCSCRAGEYKACLPSRTSCATQTRELVLCDRCRCGAHTHSPGPTSDSLRPTQACNHHRHYAPPAAATRDDYHHKGKNGIKTDARMTEREAHASHGPAKISRRPFVARRVYGQEIPANAPTQSRECCPSDLATGSAMRTFKQSLRRPTPTRATSAAPFVSYSVGFGVDGKERLSTLPPRQRADRVQRALYYARCWRQTERLTNSAKGEAV